ncbi:MAG: thioredoxin fold domain-containing protein [Alcanivoracaceae bacterium]|nr:thioredoxin fold domain-containing protein [Alcanivoracaceae bacterium]
MRFAVLVFALLMNSACADQSAPAKESPAAADSAVAIERLLKAFPGISVSNVEPSPVSGMFLVQIGGDWVTISADGRFVFTGEVLELRESGVVSLIEERQKAVRGPGIAALQADQLITFPAAEQKAEVYVFTDVTCGYCRQLHRQIADYNNLGITVHYLAFPRGGLKSSAARVLSDIWCSPNRQLAMTEAKLDKPLSQTPADCDSPVASQYQLGEQFGVAGTPAVFTVDGEQLGGYLPPAKMAQDLGLQ